ncbi:MAG TPA: Yip1 family protein, partial [Usitatibacteraceae bacterium]|nr:Yip1 family protein [Usitatibacteraceae bacterium]
GVGGFGFSYKVGVVAGLVGAIVQIVMGLIGVVIVGYIIDALAPTFGAEKNLQQAIKTAVYALTAAWLGGVFGIIPALGIIGLLFSIYGIYLLYLGLPVTMKCPAEKAIPYTAVTVVAAFIVMIIIGVVVGSVTAIGSSRGSFSIGDGSGGKVTVDAGSAAGKLDQFAKKMEEAGKKMEAAQKSGNQDEANKAAMAALGTVLGGGKNVDPVDIEQLKPLVPDTFAGLPKKSSKAEKAGALGIMVSKAEARYGDEAGKRVDLEITDAGGAGGMMAFAGWAMVQGEREDESGREKTGKVDGRLTHEKMRKDGRNEFSVVIAERFVVTAKGKDVDLNALKSAVAGLDLKKLDALKDVGVSK